MYSLSLLFEDGLEPHGFIFYIPLSELFSITENTMERLKPCFARPSIPITGILFGTDSNASTEASKDLSVESEKFSKSGDAHAYRHNGRYT
jgi:hypothetical protein